MVCCCHAKQGHREAQYRLSQLYANGEGVRENFVIALKWVDLCQASSEPGVTDSEDLRKVRAQIAKEMIPTQIGEAQRLAGELKAKATPEF